MSNERRKGWMLLAALAVATVAGRWIFGGLAAVPGPDGPGPSPPSTQVELHASTPGSALSSSARLDRGAVRIGGDGRVMMELILRGAEMPGRQAVRRPTDFIVTLDRSGSMAGEKLDYAKTAVRELIDQLEDDDRFALVAYESGSAVIVPLTSATPRMRDAWRHKVEEVVTGGGTNMSGGLDLALDVSRHSDGSRPTRVLLISDGLANEGDASVEGLAGRAAGAAHRAVVLSAIGVGDDFDEEMLVAVADAGTGNFYYLDHPERLAAVFTAELGASRETVASAVEVAFRPAAGVRLVDAGGYPLEEREGTVAFRPGSLFAGQERSLWLTFEATPQAPGSLPLGTLALAYREDGAARQLAFAEAPTVTAVADEETFLAGIDRDAWGRGVVEEDYSRLRQKVASYVKAGQREEALEAIDQYRAEKAELNRQLDNPAVTHNLAEAKALESEIDDAFTGANQAGKQKVLRKQYQASAWDARRKGSKKGSGGQ